MKMNRIQLNRFTKEVEKLFESVGAIKIEPRLGYNSTWKLKTRSNELIMNLEKSIQSEGVFSIFARFTEKPVGATNSKYNLHLWNNSLTIEPIKSYLESTLTY